MNKKLETKIQINADASQARNEIGKFESGFTRTLNELGKTRAEVRHIRALAREIREGAKSTDALDKETRELVTTYNSMRAVANDRNLLGIRSHEKIRGEIQKVEAAYTRLKASGKLSGRELSQAAEATKTKVRALRQEMDVAGKSADSYASGFQKVKGKVLAAGLAIAGVVRSVKSWVEASNVQERAETKLATTLRNLTGASNEQIAALKEQAAALQKLTGYGDENTISAQAMLGTFALTADQIGLLTPRLLDMAESARKAGNDSVDLESISVALGKAFTAGIGSLSRYGVAMTEAQKEAFKLADQEGKVALLTEILDNNFKGLAESVGSTFEGKVRGASAAFGDLKEAIGKQITQNAAVVKANKLLGDAWDKMSEGIGSSSGEIGEAITFLGSTVQTIFGGIRATWNVAQIAFKGLVLLINEGIQKINEGMAKVTFGETSRQFKQAAADIAKYNQEMRDSIGEDVADLADAGRTMIGAWDDLGEKMDEQGAAALRAGEQNAAAADGLGKAEEKAKALTDAYKALGIETEAVTRQSEAQTVAAFEAIASSAESGADVLNAFAAALAKVATEESVNALKMALYDAFNEGRLGAKEYLAQLDAVDQRLAAIGVTVQDTEGAFKHFGLTSADELQNVADKSREMFESLEQSGRASTEQLEAAFLKYAEQAIRAQDGVISKELEAKAGTLGLIDEVGVLAKQFERTGAFGAEAFRIAAREGRALRDAINEINHATTRSQLADMANDAARAWREGKITAGEYMEIMDEIDQRRAELIRKTDQQVDAERKLTDQTAKTKEELAEAATYMGTIEERKRRIAAGNDDWSQRVYEDGSTINKTTRSALTFDPESYIRERLAKIGQAELFSDVFSKFQQYIAGEPADAELFQSKASSAISAILRAQRLEAARASSENTAKNASQPGKTITMVFRTEKDGAETKGQFGEDDAMKFIEQLERSALMTRG